MMEHDGGGGGDMRGGVDAGMGGIEWVVWCVGGVVCGRRGVWAAWCVGGMVCGRCGVGGVCVPGHACPTPRNRLPDLLMAMMH